MKILPRRYDRRTFIRRAEDVHYRRMDKFLTYLFLGVMAVLASEAALGFYMLWRATL